MPGFPELIKRDVVSAKRRAAPSCSATYITMHSNQSARDAVAHWFRHACPEPVGIAHSAARGLITVRIHGDFLRAQTEILHANPLPGPGSSCGGCSVWCRGRSMAEPDYVPQVSSTVLARWEGTIWSLTLEAPQQTASSFPSTPAIQRSPSFSNSFSRARSFGPWTLTRV